ncbi:MAG: glutamyl-tRNA amidotransferase [Desulfuromonas sp.]|nr:MAG: glutamyl-tRNA amidotransferase [Desulfuromonas sp.]
MSLKAQLTQAMKEAMKAKDTVRLTTVRMALAAVKNKEIEAGKELDDAAVTALLSTLAKQRREAAEAYRDGDREELAVKEEAELVVIQSFLPEPLTEAELDELIEAAVAESGAGSMKDMGKVMKLVSAQTTGRADGRLVSERVKARLSA